MSCVFDDKAYLTSHPEVRQQIRDGRYTSALAHFEQVGRKSGWHGCWKPLLRDQYVAPRKSGTSYSFVGGAHKKPWHYRVTVAVPHLGTPEILEVLVSLHRLQTVPPFLFIVDTGSNSDDLSRVQALRADDLEVHEIAMVGTPHPSDFPAVAMDLAFSACRTEYLFATHSDCLPRIRDLLEWYLDQCDAENPVVGYEMSPRTIGSYRGFVSHTATMFHMPTMWRAGVQWSQHHLRARFNPPEDAVPQCGGWPDTEVLPNMILRSEGSPLS